MSLEDPKDFYNRREPVLVRDRKHRIANIVAPQGVNDSFLPKSGEWRIQTYGAGRERFAFQLRFWNGRPATFQKRLGVRREWLENHNRIFERVPESRVHATRVWTDTRE
ncbi:hypothetical protein EVAR_74939_1 [Eumeta japonica]|uniref:Uncharacterized protein n=1 Tax=Eumeta variegata TaxID=151549 RepID=A0A4C1UJA6_EUMVA|nr:hypothetical protein EVAR_74939_1 [Eumeta japonica]